MNNTSIAAMTNAEFLLSAARDCILGGTAKIDCPAAEDIVKHIEAAERLLKDDISKMGYDVAAIIATRRETGRSS